MKVGTQLSQLRLESHFCLRYLHFHLFPVCTAVCCLRSIPGFLLQLLTSILLYLVLWLLVDCCFLFIVDLPFFYLQFDDGNFVGAPDICSYALDLDRWSDLPADDGVARLVFFDLSSHEFCVFWMHFDEGKQYLQELSWTPSTNQNEQLAPFFSWYPTLICIFHFLVVTSLIATSSIERNNLYFDILTITFWRQL